jgi:hypothetical protein
MRVGGAEGWSAAQQRVREAEGDGGRGTSSPRAACECGKQRGCERIAEGVRADRGAKWGHSFLGATDADIRRRNELPSRTSGRALLVPGR